MVRVQGRDGGNIRLTPLSRRGRKRRAFGGVVGDVIVQFRSRRRQKSRPVSSLSRWAMWRIYSLVLFLLLNDILPRRIQVSLKIPIISPNAYRKPPCSHSQLTPPMTPPRILRYWGRWGTSGVPVSGERVLWREAPWGVVWRVVR